MNSTLAPAHTVRTYAEWCVRFARERMMAHVSVREANALAELFADESAVTTIAHSPMPYALGIG